jgi:plastocyanin
VKRPVLAAAVVALALMAPAATAHATDFPPTASFTAYDSVWVANGSLSAEDNFATLAPGGTVTFSYPAGMTFHNADFGTGPSPTSCTQTAGDNSGSVPPLPAFPGPPGWSGTCKFDTPGTYTFICDAHPDFMKGTVYVGVDPPAKLSGPPLTWPTGPTTGGGGNTGSGGSSSPTRPSAKFARSQRGSVVRGTVTTPVSGSKIVVTAFAASRLLAKPARQVSIGSQTKKSKSTGKTSFSVKLKASARRALQRRHRLALTLRIVVTSPGAKAVRSKVAITLRDH